LTEENMKSYDYEACTWEGEIFCLECLPESVTEKQIEPIFADSEWDSYPVCCECGIEHDYVSLTSYGLAERERDSEIDYMGEE